MFCLLPTKLPPFQGYWRLNQHDISRLKAFTGIFSLRLPLDFMFSITLSLCLCTREEEIRDAYYMQLFKSPRRNLQREQSAYAYLCLLHVNEPLRLFAHCLYTTQCHSHRHVFQQLKMKHHWNGIAIRNIYVLDVDIGIYNESSKSQEQALLFKEYTHNSEKKG